MKLPKALASRGKNSGFTIFELLIVFGVLAVIFSLGIPVSYNFYLDYQLNSQRDTLISALRQARNLSLVNYNESDHGVEIAGSQITVFQGASYAARIQTQDKNYPRDSGITISGATELIFTALSGASASTTYTVDDTRKTRTVYVNPEGLVYEP